MQRMDTSGMKSLVPQGRSLPLKVQESDVTQAFQGAGVNSNDTINGDAPRQTLPAPLVLPSPSSKVLCMEGKFSVNESEGTHCCMGRWAMNKGHLEASVKQEFLASAFDFRIKAEPSSFPCNGYYQSSFRVRHPRPRPTENIQEDELFLTFDRNSAGDWNAGGHGHNKYGSFTLIGRLYADRRLEVYRFYNTKTSNKSSDGGGAKAGGSRRHGEDHMMASDGKRRVKNQKASGTEPLKILGFKRKPSTDNERRAKLFKRGISTEPLTFKEKQSLSDCIKQLNDYELGEVFGIILARMPIGSSGSQGLELEMDFMDVITLRHLQGYIRELRERHTPDS